MREEALGLGHERTSDAAYVERQVPSGKAGQDGEGHFFGEGASGKWPISCFASLSRPSLDHHCAKKYRHLKKAEIGI